MWKIVNVVMEEAMISERQNADSPTHAPTIALKYIESISKTHPTIINYLKKGTVTWVKEAGKMVDNLSMRERQEDGNNQLLTHYKTKITYQEQMIAGLQTQLPAVDILARLQKVEQNKVSINEADIKAVSTRMRPHIKNMVIEVVME